MTTKRSMRALSAMERLERAMARHTSLHAASPHASSSSAGRQTTLEIEPVMARSSLPASHPQEQCAAHVNTTPPSTATVSSASVSAHPSSPIASSASSVAALGEQLQSLWRREPTDSDTGIDSNADHTVAATSDAVSTPELPIALQQALVKIGSHEKDELLVHLLQQVTSYRTQLSEVATLGETIAAQLVHQQHALRVKHREQLEQLERELHDALHRNPRVAALEDKIADLEAHCRAKDQQLHTAVQKLQRSRQREKELKAMCDPLWDI